MEQDYNTLEKLKVRKSPFTVPDNYFEQLEQRIAQQTEHIAPMKSESAGKRNYWKPLLYLVAMFAGAFFVVRMATGIGEWIETSDVAQANAQESVSTIDFSSARDYTLASMNEYALYEYYCDEVEQ